MIKQIRKKLRKYLVWATVDQACDIKPLFWYQRFFRYIGWPKND